MFDKIKQHLSRNKKTYIVGGAGLLVGATTGFLLCKNGIQIVDSGKLVHIQWKSPNTVHVEMVRPGPKSFVVQCEESQLVYPSVRAAAKDLGMAPSIISKNLKGEYPDAKGFHFVKLSEV